ncbi:unnamed protein product [Linum trigynum]|uniref:Uncharacterized protein n=1 Tax=Linum trigynum TaxID=586398 RepID=A0AAV2EZQ3_9ROSI
MVQMLLGGNGVCPFFPNGQWEVGEVERKVLSDRESSNGWQRKSHIDRWMAVVKGMQQSLKYKSSIIANFGSLSLVLMKSYLQPTSLIADSAVLLIILLNLSLARFESTLYLNRP